MVNNCEYKKDLNQIFRAGVAAVQPDQLIPKALKLKDGRLRAGEQVFPIDHFSNVYVAGAGKATAAMASEVEKILKGHIADGVIAIKTGHAVPLKYVRQIEAGHPFPDINSVIAAEDIKSLVKNAGPRDLIIFLLSGGASSLMTDLPHGCNLDDMLTVSRLLLNCGASISEMNTVRKHLSELKGGRLAKLAGHATIISFIISDVIGNDLSVIGSGPTTADITTYEDALQVLEKYKLKEKMPESVLSYLHKGYEKIKEDVLRGKNGALKNCSNYIIGDINLALEAAAKEASRLGYETKIISGSIEGLAEDAAKKWIKEIKDSARSNKQCFIGGGETTVDIKGNGKGGRNQHFALAAALEISRMKNIYLLSAGTDGTDGPTDAAGAMVDGNSVSNARAMNLSPEKFLADNDSYSFFDKSGGHLKTGPTQTNVMDIVITLTDNPA